MKVYNNINLWILFFFCFSYLFILFFPFLPSHPLSPLAPRIFIVSIVDVHHIRTSGQAESSQVKSSRGILSNSMPFGIFSFHVFRTKHKLSLVKQFSLWFILIKPKWLEGSDKMETIAQHKDIIVRVSVPFSESITIVRITVSQSADVVSGCHYKFRYSILHDILPSLIDHPRYESQTN